MTVSELLANPPSLHMRGERRDFLKEEGAWELVAEPEGRTALFRKLADGSATREWREQPYVVARSDVMTPTRNALRLFFSGRWRDLGAKVAKRLRAR